MFNKIRIGAAGVAIVAAMGMASPAAAVSANGTAEAEILAALTLAPYNGSTLDFGTIAVNGADTVYVDAFGLVSCGVNLVCSGTQSPITFEVTGGANQNVLVTVPSGSITVSNGTGGTMTVDNFNDDTFGWLPLGTGTAYFNVGATLNVGAAQAAGSYTGTFSVSAIYQ